MAFFKHDPPRTRRVVFQQRRAPVENAGRAGDMLYCFDGSTIQPFSMPEGVLAAPRPLAGQGRDGT
jgi:hypothetical protein